jgi:hypothetical protein
MLRDGCARNEARLARLPARRRLAWARAGVSARGACAAAALPWELVELVGGAVGAPREWCD